MIKTWQQRCEEHPDHNGIVREGMIQARMQEEIDELRAALEPRHRSQAEGEEHMTRQCPSCGGFCKQSGCERENIPLSTAPRQWQGLTADEIWDEWCKQTKSERDTRNFVAAFASAIEAKLREKNA